MENNFWNVECSGCGKVLKTRVREGSVGRTVTLYCIQCGAETTTTIGASTESSSEVDKKIAKLMENIMSDPENRTILNSLVEEGYRPFLAMGLVKLEPGEKPEFKPKVDENGKIKVGTFTEEDEKSFKNVFKIKL